MGINRHTETSGIEVVTIDYPPVNALPTAGWFDLADAVTAAGRDPETRVVVLRAEGRGFNAGVDIKEIQRNPGHQTLIDANHGCYAAFGAVYDCQVPVIAAVHGFCLGGGIGLVGNADVIVAADDATFGLPEVERGALGAATHLARLVPQHMMRTLFYTASTVTAQQLHHFGSVHKVVPRAGWIRPHWNSPRASPPRTAGSSAPPNAPSTASTCRTCTAATDTSRASPSS